MMNVSFIYLSYLCAKTCTNSSRCHLIQSISTVKTLSFLSAEIPQICRFPKEEGPCRGLFHRYFFNMTTMKCESFSYGGCQGNMNRFQDLTSCMEYCSPQKSEYELYCDLLPLSNPEVMLTGPCMGALQCGKSVAKYLNIKPVLIAKVSVIISRKEEASLMQLLLRNSTYCALCLITAVPVLCLDPLDKGRCSASIPRYYYNTATKMCEEFIYSGCGGSSNNFVSRQSCMDVCAKGV